MSLDYIDTKAKIVTNLIPIVCMRYSVRTFIWYKMLLAHIVNELIIIWCYSFICVYLNGDGMYVNGTFN